MRETATTLGGLACRVIDSRAGMPPDIVVVLCHGFGAPATDLVPLGTELLRSDIRLSARARFIFPAAPLVVEGLVGGRAWWPLDMDRIAAAVESGAVRDLRKEQPEGLKHARRKLLALIDDVMRQTGLPASRIVLGGFSQGAMVATDVALRMEEAPAALVLYSGSLLSEDDWKKRAPQRAGLRVLQSHGQGDPVLAFQAALWLRDLLTEAGLDVTFMPFGGGHTIAPDALKATAELVSALLDRIDGVS